MCIYLIVILLCNKTLTEKHKNWGYRPQKGGSHIQCQGYDPATNLGLIGGSVFELEFINQNVDRQTDGQTDGCWTHQCNRLHMKPTHQQQEKNNIETYKKR